jgi:hypothetical protein
MNNVKKKNITKKKKTKMKEMKMNIFQIIERIEEKQPKNLITSN